jgi:hypothetical protein
MTKNTGYRQMLRDRCPKVVSYALKWCKAKEKWLNYVYENFIWIYSSKKERYNAAKLIIGEKGKFDFHNTIDWTALTPTELYEWKSIESWVNFFTVKYAYIENTYLISSSKGRSLAECKYEIMKKYLIQLCPKSTDSDEVKAERNKYVNNLTDFLIDCFEGRIQ